MVHVRCLCPQMTCWMAWPVPDCATVGPGFTERGVGVGALLHRPARTHTHAHQSMDNTKSQQSCSKDCVLWGVSGSLRVPSWKWHVSLRRGIKRLEKRDEGIFCKRSTSNSRVYAQQMFAGSRLFVHHKRHGPGGSQPGRLYVMVERLRSAHAVLDQRVWRGTEAGKHLWDHVNTTHRSQREWRLRSSAFLWPAYISCRLALAVTTAQLFLSHCHGPGPAQVTRVSRLCPKFFVFFFPHPSFCHIMEYQVSSHFPWKRVHFLSHIKLNLKQKRHRVTFLLACSLSPYSFLFSLF